MATPAAEPFFFGPEGRPLAGWLHRPAVPSAVGIVVCNPFGYEAICSHRSLRHLAEAMAGAGVAALRFDYDGTGDSFGDDRDPDRLEAWGASVREACSELRRACGVARIYLVGVRLGALIGAVAAESAGVDGLIAIAPVVSGRAYLRELGLLQMALGLGVRPPDHAPPPDEVEALGFTITAQTRAAVAKVDLTKLPGFERDGAPFEVFVIDRDDLPSAEKWVASLGARGVAVSSCRQPGYVEMMLDPHKTIIPDGIIRTAIDWISTRRETSTASGGIGTSPASTEARFGDVVERPVFVDRARRVFGVLSSPATTPSGRAVLLLNAGAIHHVGPNRLYVKLARRWAGMGDHVLRMDIRGIGDSPSGEGDVENIVYPRRALDDVHAAVSFLRREHGGQEVIAVGLCAGAFHAISAAFTNPDVTGYVAINPLTFVRPPEGPVDFPASRVSAEAERYQRSLFDLEKWKKLLRGKAHVRVMAEVFARHTAVQMKARARGLSRRLHVPWRDDVGVELDRLARRRVTQSFIFAKDDPGQRLLREYAGSVVTTLAQRGSLAIDVIDGPDHTFTPVWSHEILEARLTAAITRSASSPRHAVAEP